MSYSRVFQDLSDLEMSVSGTAEDLEDAGDVGGRSHTSRSSARSVRSGLSGAHIRPTLSPSPSVRSGATASRSPLPKVKACPICDALISASHLARHVRNVHSLPSSASSLVPIAYDAVSTPVARRPTSARTVIGGPVSRFPGVSTVRDVRQPTDDSELISAAKAMYKAKSSLGMGVEGLCAAGASSVPSLSREAQRHLAVAIHVAALETQEVARSVKSSATFQAHIARVATQALDVPPPIRPKVMPT